MATETRKELIDKFDNLSDRHFAGDIELNDWEENFISDIEHQLKDDEGYLTDLQIEKLEEIYEKYNR